MMSNYDTKYSGTALALLPGQSLEYYYSSHVHCYCKNSMVILTNKNGYLSCTFVLSMLDTEQMHKA